jgi:hypothetical protein
VRACKRRRTRSKRPYEPSAGRCLVEGNQHSRDRSYDRLPAAPVPRRQDARHGRRLEDHVWTVDELIGLLSTAEATPIKRGTYRKTRERKPELRGESSD